MNTRSGDLDPGLVLFLVKKFGHTKAKNIIEKESGLTAFTKAGGMFKALYLADEKIEDPAFTTTIERTKEKEIAAKLALEIYVQKIKKYIGAYAAEMGGVDTIAFTGKIGAGSSVIREKITSGLEFIKIGKIEIVQPDEELAMALELIKIK